MERNSVKFLLTARLTSSKSLEAQRSQMKLKKTLFTPVFLAEILTVADKLRNESVHSLDHVSGE